MNSHQKLNHFIRKNFSKTIFLYLIITLSLYSCLPNALFEMPSSQPTVDISFLYTQAVETAQAQVYFSLTETAIALPTQTPFPTATNTLIPTPTIIPTNTLVWAQINNASCIPNNNVEIGRVVEVVDGDTIKVLLDDKVYSVRYIGINTPETNGEAYSLESTLKNEELVFGKEVMLIKDVSETDLYGRLLRYIIVDNVFVNLELVSQGYARATAYPPDTACEKTFQDVEQLAKNSSLGIWMPQPLVVPVIQNTPSSGSNGNCDPSYPGVCIPPAPPDLDCGDIPYKRFQVLPPDPHNFDRDTDGIGCES